MPLGSSRGNSRLSTPSTSTSVSASASASGSSPSLTAYASALVAAAASAPSESNDGAAAVAAAAASVTTLPAPTAVTSSPSAKAIQFTACPVTTKTPAITAAAATTTTASSSSSSSSPSRPSLLSRLSRPLHLPLRSRPRSITDFHILCDEPHKKYIAGEPVRGAVVILVTKPLRLTHLVVTLHGFVRVLKDAAAVAKVQTTTTLPPGGSSSRPQYHGNGFASLFQDEQVLCGEGRLEPGRYEFQFDLVFPDKGLPSSIDFERGTISYMITATLTKPTSIAPTVSCERKIMLAERINVGLLAPPRPRAIFLEPISKRTRRKKSSMTLERGSAVPLPPPPLQSTAAVAAAAAAAETTDLTSEAGSLELSVTASESAHDLQPDQRGTAQSDVQSEVSGESGRSTGAALTANELSLQFRAAHQQAVDNKTITATIELLKGGCLPGDTVSVRVTVQHVKRVKSMTGVVVTLFRQGKIDYAPSSSLFSGTISKEDARRLQMDEMYPRSRTGLSGLSLSSAGSVSMFRKDLDQTTAPLIIDPVTLQASITVPVKVPDDSFPTIRGVPGDMISFKYQVEVIVDLGGKLSGQLQGGQTAKLGPFNTGSDMAMNMFSSRREASIVETSQLKRQKGVISVSMESVVGTVDSSSGRKHGKARQRTDGASEDGYDTDAGNPDEADSLPVGDTHAQQRPQPYSSPRLSPRSYPSPSSHPADHYTRGPAPCYVPPPRLPDPRSMSEKDRVRQAEARLLPSQPPAGPAPDDDDIYDAHDHPRVSQMGEPSAPTEEELEAGHVPGAEDKQERERRRLMQEASAPEFPEDGAVVDAVTDEPTAPVLDDGDEDYAYGSSGRSGGRGEGGEGEQLPAYQR